MKIYSFLSDHLWRRSYARFLWRWWSGSAGDVARQSRPLTSAVTRPPRRPWSSFTVKSSRPCRRITERRHSGMTGPTRSSSWRMSTGTWYVIYVIECYLVLKDMKAHFSDIFLFHLHISTKKNSWKVKRNLFDFLNYPCNAETYIVSRYRYQKLSGTKETVGKSAALQLYLATWYPFVIRTQLHGSNLCPFLLRSSTKSDEKAKKILHRNNFWGRCYKEIYT